MSNLEPIFEFKKASKIYSQTDEIVLFKDLDLKIFPKDFICIQGVSGVGKSTLLHILGLLESLTSGDIYFQGDNIENLNDTQLSLIRREFIGFVFQFHHLLSDFNVFENSIMPLRLQKKVNKKSKKRVMDLLNMVGMSHRLKHLPKELSGGERQRIALVRSLAHQPSILFADEPSGNLDQNNSRHLSTILTKIHQELNTTIVYVTHDQSLSDIAEKKYFMDQGKLTLI